ncbi:hypothetical protein VTH06DRAFT_510 [Thermothelomyces fergusii]
MLIKVRTLTGKEIELDIEGSDPTASEGRGRAGGALSVSVPLFYFIFFSMSAALFLMGEARMGNRVRVCFLIPHSYPRLTRVFRSSMWPAGMGMVMFGHKNKMMGRRNRFRERHGVLYSIFCTEGNVTWR